MSNANVSINIVNLIVYSYLGALAFFVGLPFFEATWSNFTATSLPYKMKFWYSLENFPVYLITFWYTAWLSFSCVFFISAESYFMTLCMSHLAGQFLILRRSIKCAYENCLKFPKVIQSSDSYKQSRLVEALYAEIKNCVIKQAKFKKFGSEMQSIYSIRYFISLTCNTILLCLTVFQLFTNGLDYKIIRYFFWGSGATLEILILGFMGSDLTEISESIALAFYDCRWENVLSGSAQSSRKTSKLLKLIAMAILISQEPVTISALGYFDLSIKTSQNAISTSVSYLMFLNTMKMKG